MNQFGDSNEQLIISQIAAQQAIIDTNQNTVIQQQTDLNNTQATQISTIQSTNQSQDTLITQINQSITTINGVNAQQQTDINTANTAINLNASNITAVSNLLTQEVTNRSNADATLQANIALKVDLTTYNSKMTQLDSNDTSMQSQITADVNNLASNYYTKTQVDTQNTAQDVSINSRVLQSAYDTKTALLDSTDASLLTNVNTRVLQTTYDAFLTANTAALLLKADASSLSNYWHKTNDTITWNKIQYSAVPVSGSYLSFDGTVFVWKTLADIQSSLNEFVELSDVDFTKTANDIVYWNNTTSKFSNVNLNTHFNTVHTYASFDNTGGFFSLKSVNNTNYALKMKNIQNSNEEIQWQFNGSGQFNTCVYNNTTKILSQLSGLTSDYMNQANLFTWIKNGIEIQQFKLPTGTLDMNNQSINGSGTIQIGKSIVGESGIQLFQKNALGTTKNIYVKPYGDENVALTAQYDLYLPDRCDLNQIWHVKTYGANKNVLAGTSIYNLINTVDTSSQINAARVNLSTYYTKTEIDTSLGLYILKTSLPLNISAPVNNNYLMFNGTNWINQNLPSFSTTLAALTDINFTVAPPTNLQVLQYQTIDNKWHPYTLPGAQDLSSYQLKISQNDFNMNYFNITNLIALNFQHSASTYPQNGLQISAYNHNGVLRSYIRFQQQDVNSSKMILESQTIDLNGNTLDAVATAQIGSIKQYSGTFSLKDQSNNVVLDYNNNTSYNTYVQSIRNQGCYSLSMETDAAKGIYFKTAAQTTQFSITQNGYVIEYKNLLFDSHRMYGNANPLQLIASTNTGSNYLSFHKLNLSRISYFGFGASDNFHLTLQNEEPTGNIHIVSQNHVSLYGTQVNIYPSDNLLIQSNSTSITLIRVYSPDNGHSFAFRSQNTSISGAHSQAYNYQDLGVQNYCIANSLDVTTYPAVNAGYYYNIGMTGYTYYAVEIWSSVFAQNNQLVALQSDEKLKNHFRLKKNEGKYTDKFKRLNVYTYSYIQKKPENQEDKPEELLVQGLLYQEVKDLFTFAHYKGDREVFVDDKLKKQEKEQEFGSISYNELTCYIILCLQELIEKTEQGPTETRTYVQTECQKWKNEQENWVQGKLNDLRDEQSLKLVKYQMLSDSLLKEKDDEIKILVNEIASLKEQLQDQAAQVTQVQESMKLMKKDQLKLLGFLSQLQQLQSPESPTKI